MKSRLIQNNKGCSLLYYTLKTANDCLFCEKKLNQLEQETEILKLFCTNVKLFFREVLSFE